MPTIDQQLNATPDATDQAIADAVNASPDRYRSVTSAAGLEWVAGNGRLAKIEGAIVTMATSTDAATLGLRNALRVFLLALGNPSSYLTLDPASDQRTMLDACVAAGIIEQADADALLAKAKIGEDVTAGNVAAVRAAMALYAAKDAALVALETYASGIRDAVNAAETIDAIPTIPALPQ